MKDRQRCLLKKLRLNDSKSALCLFALTDPTCFGSYPYLLREYHSIRNDCTLLKSAITNVAVATVHCMVAYELHC